MLCCDVVFQGHLYLRIKIIIIIIIIIIIYELKLLVKSNFLTSFSLFCFVGGSLAASFGVHELNFHFPHPLVSRCIYFSCLVTSLGDCG